MKLLLLFKLFAINGKKKTFFNLETKNNYKKTFKKETTKKLD